VITVEFSETVDKEIFAEISEIHRLEKINDNRWKITGSMETDLRPVLFQFAVDKGLTVISLQRETQKLEDVFQKLTQKN
jgi:ABC-2 type transport system ATP-binding protein